MPAVVQHRSAFGNGATTLALAFASGNTASNLLVYCTSSSGGVTLNTATDNNTNTIANATSISGNGLARIDYVANAHAGACTVTGHVSAATPMHLHLYEISGCVTATPVRATGTAANNTGATVSTSTTTPLTGDAVVGFFHDDPIDNALVAGTGYTPSEFTDNTTGGNSALSEYKTATTGGTQTATCTGNSANGLDEIIVVFIQAAAGSNNPAVGMRSFMSMGHR